MPLKPSETARAIAYRNEQTARVRRAAQNEKHTLAGSRAARQELEDNWEPVVNRDLGWDPPGERLEDC